MADFQVDYMASIIGEEFARQILAEFPADTIAEIRRLNAIYDPLCCATHNFCDANMVMLDAFNVIGEPASIDFDDDSAGHDRAADIWNAAWAHAKRRYLIEGAA